MYIDWSVMLWDAESHASAASLYCECVGFCLLRMKLCVKKMQLVGHAGPCMHAVIVGCMLFLVSIDTTTENSRMPFCPYFYSL